MRTRSFAAALTVALIATAGGAGAQDKKDEKKPAAAAPAAQGNACDCKRTSKCYYCLKCDRELTQDDVRNNVCKRCETKPAQIEYCVKALPSKFIPDCHPNKASDKPVS